MEIYKIMTRIYIKEIEGEIIQTYPFDHPDATGWRDLEDPDIQAILKPINEEE